MTLVDGQNAENRPPKWKNNRQNGKKLPPKWKKVSTKMKKLTSNMLKTDLQNAEN